MCVQELACLWMLHLNYETFGLNPFSIRGAGGNCLALVLLYLSTFTSSQEREEEMIFAALLEAGPLVGTEVLILALLYDYIPHVQIVPKQITVTVESLPQINVVEISIGIHVQQDLCN